MKSYLSFIIVLFLALPSHAMLGLLGRDQCNYQQTSYPTYQNDTQQAAQVQLQGLYSQKKQLEARWQQLDQQSRQLQEGLRSYFPSPWCEPMLQHMDNNLDCCAPTGVYAILNFQENGRRPAGQDLNTEIKDPYPVDPVPEDVPPYVPPKVVPNSCQGYPAQYCSNDWGKPYEEPKPGAGLCLQTGFAATPAWYRAACRNGGRIDYAVCSNPQIMRTPAMYRQCIDMLESYQRVTKEKRQLSAHIREVGASINAYGGNNNYDGGTSETKSGFLSGLGSFLGNVVSTLGPIMLNQYMAYKQEKSMSNYNNRYYAPGSRMAKYGPPRPVVNVDGSTTMPGSFQRPYFQRPNPPPPYYGPRYGYPFNYGGNYGAMLPGYQLGGFGCTPGTQNTGMSLLGSLLGGTLNGNVNLQSNFGIDGGYAPYQGYLNAYGNQYSGIPPYTFPGHMPPYQPGDIYGTTPLFRPPLPNSAVPNYYTSYNKQPLPGYAGPYNPGYSYTNYSNLPGRDSNLGFQYDSYYYAQQTTNQRMMMENEARMRQRQYDMDYRMRELTYLNASYQNQPSYLNPSLSYNNSSIYSNYTSTNPNAYRQVDMQSLLQGLLSGQSAYFNLNMRSY